MCSASNSRPSFVTAFSNNNGYACLLHHFIDSLHALSLGFDSALGPQCFDFFFEFQDPLLAVHHDPVEEHKLVDLWMHSP